MEINIKNHWVIWKPTVYKRRSSGKANVKTQLVTAAAAGNGPVPHRDTELPSGTTDPVLGSVGNWGRYRAEHCDLQLLPEPNSSGNTQPHGTKGWETTRTWTTSETLRREGVAVQEGWVLMSLHHNRPSSKVGSQLKPASSAPHIPVPPKHYNEETLDEGVWAREHWLPVFLGDAMSDEESVFLHRDPRFSVLGCWVPGSG